MCKVAQIDSNYSNLFKDTQTQSQQRKFIMYRLELPFLSELISGQITKVEKTLWPLPNIASLTQIGDYSASGIVFLQEDNEYMA